MRKSLAGLATGSLVLGLGLAAPPASAAEGSIRIVTNEGIAYGQHLESWRMSLPVDTEVRCPSGARAYIVHGLPVPHGSPQSETFTCTGSSQRLTIYPAAYEDTVDLTAELRLAGDNVELGEDSRIIKVLDHQIHWGSLKGMDPVPAGSRVALEGELEYLTHGSHKPLSITAGVFFNGNRVGNVTSATDGRFRFPTRITRSGEWQLRWTGGRHDYATNAVTIQVKKPDPPATQLPGAPGYSAGKLTKTTAAMHWSAPKQPGTEKITGYRFGWKSSNGKPQPDWHGDWTAPPNPLVMINLHPGTTYQMWVQALTAKGAGKKATVSVTTPKANNPPPQNPEIDAPSAPRRFSATPKSTSTARLRWAPPADNGGAAIDRYQLRLKKPAASWTFSGKTRTVLMTKMKANTRYTFTVRAHNKAGWGVWSSAVTVRTLKPAPKPRTYRNCAALNKVYPHGVGLKGARDKTSGQPVTNFQVSYQVYRRNNGKELGKFPRERDLDRDNDKIACEKR